MTNWNFIAVIAASSFLSYTASATLFEEKLNLSQFIDHSEFYYTDTASTQGLYLDYILKNNPLTGQYEGTLGHYHDIDLLCDRPISLKRPYNDLKIGNHFNFDMYDKSYPGATLLKFPLGTKCVLKTKIMNTDEETTIKILPFRNQYKAFKTLYSSNSDTEQVLDSGLLADPNDALNKRIEILLGRKFSLKDFDRRDPWMPIDVSNLPKFDLIYVSTLQMNSDFVAHILLRLLLAHAKLGTPVVFTTSDVLLSPKENIFLEWLEKQSPNIKIIRYKYAENQSREIEKLNALHRVYHGKLFITYSASNPELNYLIGGGRNMSDRYFFKNKSEFVLKNLTQYDDEMMNPWAYFFDLDFYFQAPGLVKRSLQELLTFSQVKTYPKPSITNETDLIHSIPFSDGKILEKKYLKLIKSAQSKIAILSPYIYFTENIKAALKEAANRGVKIDVILSSSLMGDSMTKAVKNLYDGFIARNLTYINVYEFPMGKDEVMHRKGMLIDNSLLILGSVNMSRRSFVHDAETIVLTKEEKIIEEYQQLYSSMLKRTTRIPLSKAGKLSHPIETDALKLISEDLL